MEDRYLFKAKRVDNGEWVQGNLVLSDDVSDNWKAIIIPTINSRMFVRNDNVGGASLKAEWIESTDLYRRPISCVKPTQLSIGFENWYVVDKSTICQCTGLKDKNGKLIWENDIVDTKYGKAIVIWDRSEWRIEWIDDCVWRRDLHFWATEYKFALEVVGSKFDNPELLER